MNEPRCSSQHGSRKQSRMGVDGRAILVGQTYQIPCKREDERRNIGERVPDSGSKPNHHDHIRTDSVKMASPPRLVTPKAPGAARVQPMRTAQQARARRFAIKTPRTRQPRRIGTQTPPSGARRSPRILTAKTHLPAATRESRRTLCEGPAVPGRAPAGGRGIFACDDDVFAS